MQLRRARLQQKFGAAATEYDRLAQFQHLQTRRVLDSALMVLPESATLLDIGCGTGYFAHAAKDRRPAWKVIGLDLAYGMCDMAKTRCTALNADAARLPLGNASIDGAVSSLCYQWLENQPAAFAELARVLKPKSRAIIASLGEHTLHELRACAMQAQLPLGLLPMQTFDASADALRAAGFNIMLANKQLEVVHYPSVAALLDSMRMIGAGHHGQRGAVGLTGPKRWARMMSAYENLREARGIPATWEHHFFVVSKRS